MLVCWSDIISTAVCAQRMEEDATSPAEAVAATRQVCADSARGELFEPWEDFQGCEKETMGHRSLLRSSRLGCSVEDWLRINCRSSAFILMGAVQASPIFAPLLVTRALCSLLVLMSGSHPIVTPGGPQEELWPVPLGRSSCTRNTRLGSPVGRSPNGTSTRLTSAETPDKQ